MADSIDDDLDLSLQNVSPPGLPSRAEQVAQMLQMQKSMDVLQAQLMLYKAAVNTATALSNGGDPMSQTSNETSMELQTQRTTNTGVSSIGRHIVFHKLGSY